MAVQSQHSNFTTLHGIAAADVGDGERDLLVYPTSLLPFQQGKLQAMEIDSQISTSGTAGAYRSQAKVTNVLKCQYRDDSSSGSMPPRVRKGEQVLIYNEGDTDQWYWKSEGRQDGERRTDTWRKAISGTLDNVSDLGDDNSYVIEADSRSQHRMRMATSKKDGEKQRYTIEIDADKGQINICDDIGNQMYLESSGKMGMKNKDKSMILLDGKNIFLTCEGDITLDAKNGKLNLASKKEMVFNTKDQMKVQSTKDMSLNSNKNMTMKSSQEMKQEAQGNLTQSTNASWSTIFKGSGSCNGGGGSLDITCSSMNIHS